MPSAVAVMAAMAATAELATCHHSGAVKPASPPAAVVRGAFDAIAVTAVATQRTAAVPPSLRKGLAPLLIARTVDRPGPLSDYGLDAPLATLSYQLAPAAPVIVTVGGTNFDRSLFYVQRDGDAKVYLVLAEAIRPVLALVGIQVAPAAG